MIPTIGRIVHYRLASHDVTQIAESRATTIAGHPLARGNAVRIGQPVPMLIVAVHGDQPESYVNGRVFLDGSDAPHWVTSVKVGEGPGTYSWPGPSALLAVVPQPTA